MVGKTTIRRIARLFKGAAAGWLAIAAATAVAAQPKQRGPVHEALWQQIEDAAAPGAKATRPPDAPGREKPPTAMPAARSLWIPGYWAWDAAGEDFTWVSAVWRTPPPGRRWAPGYWSEGRDGWRWVRGFWFPLDQPRLRYLPEPPPPKHEPELAKVSDGEVAVAGYWRYVGGQYIWSRGFKARTQPGWLWTPSHYAWTPAGSLFVPGYWDFARGRRGAPSGRAGEIEIAPASRARVIQNAERLRLLAVQRSKFESSADASPPGRPPVFYLPAPAEPLVKVRPVERPLGDAADDSVPGLAGRRVPGAADRPPPGVSGRRLPGVAAPAIGSGPPPK